MPQPFYTELLVWSQTRIVERRYFFVYRFVQCSQSNSEKKPIAAIHGTPFAPEKLCPPLMTVKQFCALRKDVQPELVKQRGVFLFGRTGVGVNVMLYQVEGFCAEIYFNDKMSAAMQIRAFEDTIHLEPYLRMVDVSELQPLL